MGTRAAKRGSGFTIEELLGESESAKRAKQSICSLHESDSPARLRHLAALGLGLDCLPPRLHGDAFCNSLLAAAEGDRSALLAPHVSLAGDLQLQHSALSQFTNGAREFHCSAGNPFSWLCDQSAFQQPFCYNGKLFPI